MPDSTMNKVYHAAMRRDLGRFAAALDRFRPDDQEHAAALVEMYVRFDRELTHHHDAEDKIIWPYLERSAPDPSLLSQLGMEHDHLAAARRGARTALERLAENPTADATGAARGAIAELQAVAEVHFDHEERELDPLLEQADPAGWKDVQRQLQRSRSPRDLGWMLSWVRDEASAGHEAHLKQTIPRPVLFLADRLGRRGYAKARAAAWGPLR